MICKLLVLGAIPACDIPIAALGVSDQRQWRANAWGFSDLVPHFAYGPATAATYKTLASGSRRRLF